MSIFHLMHCIPDSPTPGFVGRRHGLHGYREVIESIEWGLAQLGHQVSYAVNGARPDAVNIIFGGQMMPLQFMQQLPKSTIIYNLEQIRGVQKEAIRPELKFIAENLMVWEYSRANLESWKSLGAKNVAFVPVGYAPILSRIPKARDQDIDVLMYGFPGEERVKAFHRISHAGFKAVFASGLYGAPRDALIARSKLVLNVHLYNASKIFEVVRVSYLLANRKAVVSLIEPETYIDPGMRESIKVSTMDSLVDDCLHLLTHDKDRAALEDAGFESFKKHGILDILKPVVT